MKSYQLVAVSILALFILFIQACGKHLKPQKTCNFVQNEEQQRVSWKKGLPVEIYLHSSVPPQHYLAIEAAANRWKNKLGQNLIRIALTGVSGSETPVKDGTSMVYWLREWESDRRMEQARTTVYWVGNTIYEADVRVNAGNFIFYSGDGTDVFSGVDVQSLMVHEFGHVLGLAHNEKLPTVMAVSLGNGVLRREPLKIDVDSLQCEYF